jgi:hypothetical protein
MPLLRHVCIIFVVVLRCPDVNQIIPTCISNKRSARAATQIFQDILSCCVMHLGVCWARLVQALFCAYILAASQCQLHNDRGNAHSDQDERHSSEYQTRD